MTEDTDRLASIRRGVYRAADRDHLLAAIDERDARVTELTAELENFQRHRSDRLDRIRQRVADGDDTYLLSDLESAMSEVGRLTERLRPWEELFQRLAQHGPPLLPRPTWHQDAAAVAFTIDRQAARIAELDAPVVRQHGNLESGAAIVFGAPDE